MSLPSMNETGQFWKNISEDNLTEKQSKIVEKERIKNRGILAMPNLQVIEQDLRGKSPCPEQI